MEASITFKSVAKKINDDTLLADLSFGVEKNTKFAIVGPNGSGKSTIVKLLSGILQKDKGSIYVKGYDISIKANKIKSIVGYMSQTSDFNNDININDNLSIYAQLFGFTKDEASVKIQELAKLLDFENYLLLYSSDLSYGIQRVLMFAKSIIHNPEILLLDEPTANLDPVNKELIWNYISTYLSEKTILFTTNNFEDAQHFSHRIAILYNGNIKYNGTFDYLVENTHGLVKFTISYKDTIPEQLIKNISLNPKILKPKITDNVVKFYSTDKSEYFKLLKFSLDCDINDIDISKCTLEDIFKGINLKGLE
jgi:ABC-2 type transport system ATP-binding protein